MGGSFHVQEASIKKVYDWYRNGLLKVDRRYQRKLVWTINDKTALIDTILHHYPLPLIMLVGGDGSTGVKTVMDGLQRLEAVFAFIENKYPIKYQGHYGYFNLDCLSGCWKELDRYSTLNQETPILDRDLCDQFLVYNLPLMFISEETDIEEVFKRLNSTGHKLSLQNLRQAGVTNNFSRLVHEVATTIRGDYTLLDVVDFSEMEKISLSGERLKYGLNVNEVYWVKQGIMSSTQLRRAKDEELLAHIVNFIFNGQDMRMTTEVLDSLYNPSSKLSQRTEAALADDENFGACCELIKRVHTDLEHTFKSANTSFAELLCGNPKQRNKDLVYLILFLTLVRLYQDKFVIANYAKFANAMQLLAVKEMPELLEDGEYLLTVEKRKHFIERLYPILKKYMKVEDFNPEWNAEVVELLKQAQLESSNYDFKVGLHVFQTDEDRSKIILEKCLKTLAAMCNSNPAKTCYIIIGIANDAKQAKAFEQKYNTVVFQLNNVFVAGVNAEASKYYAGLDAYLLHLTDTLKMLPSYNGFTESIASSAKIVRYNDRTLITLSYCTHKPIVLDGELYTRDLVSNHFQTTTDVNRIIELSTSFFTRMNEADKK